MVVGFMAVSAITFGISKKQSGEMLNLIDANVEALAQGRSSGGCGWGTRETFDGWEAICIKGGPGYECPCGDVKYY